MKISTRSRYGIRLLFELARNFEQGPLMLREIGKRQKISLKYLSTIIIPLKSERLVLSMRGAHGGYALARNPGAIDLEEVVNVLEGGLSLVDSVYGSDDGFSEPEPFKIVWENMNRVLREYLAGLTLRDLVEDYNQKQLAGAHMYEI
jgi:Rrf2 family protein